ncbi:hypothetical protein MNEG_1811 [Monoraphidium neglectum]|uniref:Uncharacterized protein n=1 Tax=Monoraphidium neglectum TaxID=145388 RepID=A0A0D2NP02_9CHLO|nr:hypothetical protein MNEG_1811 [Monoraphidium neglectum]KIZ06146.1 hypothetical protein MNEG_1811 [Monoraphidium neglectum]|eukprot:XP_013905165.1 hypothetical protein MNEG_1811 [Monoraphidium neglectum]
MSLPLPELPAKDQAEAPPAPPTAPAGSNMSSPKKSDIFVVKGAAAAALLNPELARLAPGSPLGAAMAPGSPRLLSTARFTELIRMIHALEREVTRMSNDFASREGRADASARWTSSPRK